MTDVTLQRAIRHNCWANLQLLALCAGLSPEQLAWTAPGTYGSLHSTLHHTVGAEQGYLQALTGEAPPLGHFAPAQAPAPIDELIERERSNGERLERFLGSGDDPARRIKRPSGAIATAAIIVAQLIHHGSDHRAHVGTILGANGRAGPELDFDVWKYGRTIGEVTPPPAT